MTTREPEEPRLIIGIGNEYRRDDGVGLGVVRRIRAAHPAFRVLEASGEGAALIEAWRGAARVILCDAVHAGTPPGTIHRLDAWRQPIPTGFFRYSTHAFSLAEAVELARALGELPPQLIIYGIEGADYAAGVGLTPAVEGAAGQVAAAILAEWDLPAGASE
jgi:hydrogenase maturation protease